MGEEGRAERKEGREVRPGEGRRVGQGRAKAQRRRYIGNGRERREGLKAKMEGKAGNEKEGERGRGQRSKGREEVR